VNTEKDALVAALNQVREHITGTLPLAGRGGQPIGVISAWSASPVAP